MRKTKKLLMTDGSLNELNYSKLINGKLNDNNWPTKEQKESMVNELSGRITAASTGGTKKKKDKKKDKKNDKKNDKKKDKKPSTKKTMVIKRKKPMKKKQKK